MTTEEVDDMDIYERHAVGNHYYKIKSQERLQFLVDLADTIVVAVNANKKTDTFNGYNSYRRWRKRLLNIAYPERAKKTAEEYWKRSSANSRRL